MKYLLIKILLIFSFSINAEDIARYKIVESEAITSLVEYNEIKKLLEKGEIKKALKEIDGHINYRLIVLQAIEQQHGLGRQSYRVLKKVNKYDLVTKNSEYSKSQ